MVLQSDATNHFNVDQLLDMIKEKLPVGPMYYPKDQLLDQARKICCARND